MSKSGYNEHSEFYIDFVDQFITGDDDPVLSIIASCLGDRLSGARVCDLCCGEGYAGRYLAAQGARQVVGIDLSSVLIDEAKPRATSPDLSYRVDDAQELRSVPDDDFDVVVSQMALMDVEDHLRLFAAVRRVLVADGAFVFSMLHPCFKGRPCHVRDAPEFVLDDEGQPIAYATSRYASEGFFQTGGDGIRGRIGSYHRRLSTYINDLVAIGFRVERLEEPLDRDRGSKPELFSEVPGALVVAARAA